MSKQNFYQSKKSNLGIKDFRVWKQKTNLVSDNIIETIYKSQNKIKQDTESLNEGERHFNKKPNHSKVRINIKI